MEPRNALHFAVSDRVDDAEVGPKFVPLSLLGEFQRDVAEFLKGNSREIDPSQVMVSVEEGSFALVVTGVLAATSLWADLNSLNASKSLDAIDSKRAAVVERWQTVSRQHPSRSYAVGDVGKNSIFHVNASTDFLRGEEIWVTVEKYFYGRIVDLGGKKKPNVHLELEGGGTVTIAASQDMLAEEEHNRLYRQALLRVSVEENLITGATRNPSLLGFENHQWGFDEREFEELVRIGTRAWADVPNATEWVEELRGGRA